MSQWDGLVQQTAQKYNVDPRLIASVIQTESSGIPTAHNAETGATGLGQQIPATAKSLGIDPTDPAQSIDGIGKLLDQNLTRYGNPQQAILAYHGGTDQSAWGPKTQDYLQKVTSNYGAPQVAKQSAAPAANDFASQDFAPAAKASAPAANDFASQDFAPAAKAQPDTVIGQQQPVGGQAMPVANTAPAAQSSQPDGLVGTAWKGLQKLGEIGIGNVQAAGRGIDDALDAPAELLATGAEKSGLTGLLAKAGINMPTGDQQLQLDAASRKAYEDNTTGGFQQGLSRLAGNIAGVALPVAGAEAGLATGGKALASALDNPAALAKVGDFVAGNGGLASKATYGALQGAAGGALLSGGQPGTSAADSIGLGAILGGAAPVAGGLIRGAVNQVRGITAPFSAEGRDALAKGLIQGDAAKDAPKFATALPNAADDLSSAQPTARIEPTVSGKPDAVSGAVDDLLGNGSSKPAATPADAAGGALSRFAMNGPTKGDFTEYVPGSQPTLAQATGNAGVAQLERTMYDRDVNSFVGRQEANTAARQSYLTQIRGTPETIQAAQEAREQQAVPLLKQAFEGAGKADSQPVMNTIQGILSGPDGQRPTVQAALKPIINNLKIGQQFESDPLIPGSKIAKGINGNGLQYDVNQLYGIRKSINDQLETVAGRDNSASQLASSDLIKIKKALDTSIEGAAPGFKDYLAQYSQMSQPINAQSYLQKVDLTDQGSQKVTLSKVKQLMLKINKDRAAPGTNGAKAISDDQMQGLSNLHMDLQREANSSKGAGIGSITAQKLSRGQLVDSLLVPGQGALGQASAAGVGGLLGHALAGPVAAAPGMYIGNQAASMFNNAVAQKAPDVEARLIDYLLNSRNANALAPQGSSTPGLDALVRRASVAVPAATPAPNGQGNR